MRSPRREAFGVAIVLALIALVLFSAVAGGCSRSGLERVRLDSGPIIGAYEEVDGQKVWSFKGIPYAAPPVGDLRWQPPAPVTPWTEPRICTTFGASCPQPDMSGMAFLAAGATDEDCLFLNVWSAAESAEERLPVMVWIHGGGFETGSGSIALYGGQYLATQGVVVVTINYRLGPFGFLSHPALSAESADGVSGNYGLLDQMAALRWVQRNIAGFGGDPGNVTVLGESAGAISVLHLLVIPSAEGLFHRAIAQSGIMLDQGFGVSTTGTREQAEAAGEVFAERLGVDASGDVLAQMRAKTAEEMLAAADEIAAETGPMEQSLMWKPVADGHLLPDLPTKLWAAGLQHRVPLLIGSNADEAELFLAGMTMSPGESEAQIRKIFGAYAAEALALYPVGEAEDATRAFSRMFTEVGFASTARFAARMMSGDGAGADSADAGAGPGAATYLYEFTRVPFGNSLGAFHGVEIPYVFGTTGLFSVLGVIRQADNDLSAAMMGYWTRFATTGDPNGGGAPVWPEYDPLSDQHLELGESIGVGTGLYKEACNLADRVRLLE